MKASARKSASDGIRFAEALQSEQRIISATPWGERLVVELRVTRPRRRTPVPYVCIYSWGESGWAMQTAFGDAMQPQVVGDHTLMYIGSDLQGRPRHAIQAVSSGGQQRIVASWDRVVQSFCVADADCLLAIVGHRSETASRTVEDRHGRSVPAGFDDARDALEAVFVQGPVAGLGEYSVIDGSLLPGHQTGECALSTDGEVAAIGTVEHMPGGERRHLLTLVKTAESWSRVLRPDGWDLTRPVARPGSSEFACLAERLSEPDAPPIQLPALALANGDVRFLSKDSERWIEPHRWLDERHLLGLGLHHGERRAFLIDTGRLDDDPVDILPRSGSIAEVRVQGESFALVRSSVAAPPEVVVGSRSALHALRPLPQHRRVLSPSTLSHRIGITERIIHQTELGALGGWLCLPSGHATDLPLIVFCHGGPASSWADWSWRWNPWTYVSAGYAVFLLDPPLSLGYGAAAHLGGWGNWKRVATIAAAQVQQVLQDDRVDASRVGSMGASFGGWLALSLAALLPQVCVVASHAGWSEHRSVARSSDQYWHWLREFGPLDSPNYESQRIPLDGVAAAAQILISHGARDWHVPVAEAVGVLRQLEREDRHVELLIFPDEGHALTVTENILSWTKRSLEACESAFEGSRP